ncbi:PqqD family protein [Thermodesulfobacteriota bacterium]
MNTEVSLNGVYAPSDDIVARKIEGEIIIVPLVAGIGDMEDELYTLNETGMAIWDRLDGKNSLKDVVTQLSVEFEAPAGEIEKDVMGIVAELLQRRIIVEAS